MPLSVLIIFFMQGDIHWTIIIFIYMQVWFSENNVHFRIVTGDSIVNDLWISKAVVNIIDICNVEIDE